MNESDVHEMYVVFVIVSYMQCSKIKIVLKSNKNPFLIPCLVQILFIRSKFDESFSRAFLDVFLYASLTRITRYPVCHFVYLLSQERISGGCRGVTTTPSQKKIFCVGLNMLSISKTLVNKTLKIPLQNTSDETITGNPYDVTGRNFMTKKVYDSKI